MDHAGVAPFYGTYRLASYTLLKYAYMLKIKRASFGLRGFTWECRVYLEGDEVAGCFMAGI